MRQFSTTLSYLCGVMFLTAFCGLQADDPITQPQSQAEETKHAPAGTRALLHSEYVAYKERLAAEEQDAIQEAEEEDQTLEDAVESEECDEEEVTILPITTNASMTVLKDTLKKSSNKAGVNFGIHHGVFQQPLQVRDFGLTVELTDNSIWSVSPDDSYKTLNWLTSDIITIYRNDKWLSVYDYCLYNENTGVKVQVNLREYLTIKFHSKYNYHIIAIDDKSRSIYLNDGSVWAVDDSDYNPKWALFDTVIIGVNNSFFSFSPNILINANILHSVRATCIR